MVTETQLQSEIQRLQSQAQTLEAKQQQGINVKTELNRVSNRLQQTRKNLIDYRELQSSGYTEGQITSAIQRGNLEQQRAVASSKTAYSKGLTAQQLKDELAFEKVQEKQREIYAGFTTQEKRDYLASFGASQKIIDKVAPLESGSQVSIRASSRSVYQGPVQMGVSESTFRETGKTTEIGNDFGDVGPSRQQLTTFGFSGINVRESFEKLKGGISDNFGGLFTFGTERSGADIYGVPFVKPSEAEQLRESGSRMAVYPVQSTDFGDVIQEVKLLGDLGDIQVAPSTTINSFFGPSKEQFIFEQSQVERAKFNIGKVMEIDKEFSKSPKSFIGQEGVKTTDVDGGKLIELTPDYFNTQLKGDIKDFVPFAQERYSALPKESKRGGVASSIIGGVSRIGVGLLEFGGTLVTSLGQQTFEEGEKPSIIGKQFKFSKDTELGRIASQPSMLTSVGFMESPKQYIKEKASSPALVTEVIGTGALITAGGVGAIKNIRALGFVEGTAETLAGFAPYRAKTGVYSPTIVEKDLKLLSFKQMQGDIISRRIIGGDTGRGIKIYQTQLTKDFLGGEVGGFGTVIQRPALKISPSGKMEFGNINEIFGGYIGSGKGTPVKSFIKKGSDVGYLPENIFGGKSNVITKKFIGVEEFGGDISLEAFGGTKFLSGRSLGITKGQGAITQFEAGKRLSIGEFNPLSQAREPSGRYLFKRGIKGFEVDLNKLFGSFSEKPMIIQRGKGSGTKTPFSATFQQTQTQNIGVQGLQEAIGMTSKTSIISTGGTKLLPKLEFSMTPETKMQPISVNQFIGTQTQRGRERTSTISTALTRNLFDTKFSQAPALSLNQFLGQKQKLEQSQIMKQMLGQTSIGSIGSDFVPPKFTNDFGKRFGLGGFLLPLSLYEAPKSSGRVGGRSYTRTPSIAALGLKGTQFELPEISSPSSYEITGLFTRFIISKPKRRKKKK